MLLAKQKQLAKRDQNFTRNSVSLKCDFFFFSHWFYCLLFCFWVFLLCFVCVISLLNNKKSFLILNMRFYLKICFYLLVLWKTENVYFYGTFESINVLLQDAVFSFVFLFSRGEEKSWEYHNKEDNKLWNIFWKKFINLTIFVGFRLSALKVLG